jgi:hypothetical protein
LLKNIYLLSLALADMGLYLTPTEGLATDRAGVLPQLLVYLLGMPAAQPSPSELFGAYRTHETGCCFDNTVISTWRKLALKSLYWFVLFFVQL